ncbi:MAG: phosphotriesterase [Candidatus Bathyarchaeota archaeon]
MRKVLDSVDARASGYGLSGKVQTVLGVVDSGDLGATLSHEHVLWDASFLFVEPEEKELAYEPVRIENLEWLKRNSLGSVDNLRLLDEDVAIEELNRFKNAGGGAVVDMGNIGLRRDPEGLARVSRATGVHIVMGSGYYVGASHPPELACRPVEELTSGIVHDVTVGVDGTGIRAGVIGEIGCSYPLMETEVKVLEAVAGAQRITGAPVNIHPGRSQSLPLEIIDMYRGFGGEVRHTAMSHLSNRHGLDVDLTIELAETGCYIEYDSFGNFMNPIVLPEKTFYALSDWQRIECIKELIDYGFLDQLLISHDVFNKTDLRRYGGFGYDYIHVTVVPMMRRLGVSNEEIHAMLVENPARFLQFD